MAFAQGSRSRLTFAEETTFNTAPAGLTTLPINTHSLDGTKAGLESNQIRSDREVNVFRHGNKSVGGSVDVEMRATDYDSLLEGVLFNEFDSSNSLSLGTTLQTYSFEDAALDISQFRLFTGCGINTLDLSIRPNQIVTASFGVIGSSFTQSATAQDAAPTAAAGTEPFDSFSGSITIDSSTQTIVTGLDLNITNNLAQAFAIGSDTAQQLEFGRGNVSGQITLYYEDATQIDKFINETDADLQFTLTDGTTTYTFDLPRILFNGSSIPLDNEQSRIVTLPFVALYSSSDTYSINITKS